MSKIISLGSLLCLLLSAITGCTQVDKSKEHESGASAPYVHKVMEVDTYLSQLKAETRPYHFVDVRTSEEVADGSIEGAINIDYNSDDFTAKIKELDNSQPVYLFCRSGNRSGKAAKILIDSGYKEIYDLKGGYLKYSEKK